MAENKKIEKLLGDIRKTFGKSSIMMLDENESLFDGQVIDTGSLGLNQALGIGGLPKGRIVEIYGPESSGKTTLTIHAIANAQANGDVCAFIDAEHAFDKTYAKNLGVDTSKLIIAQPDNGEEALEITERLIRSKEVGLVVVDSVAALTPKAEIEGEMGDSKMGLQARLMSQAMRKITGAVSKSKCCCIFINQIRHKIGVMFGNPETTTGGNALKFYASIRLDIRRRGSMNKDKEGVGISNNHKVKVIKNKLAPPYRTAEFSIRFGTGIDRYGEIADIGAELEIIDKAGSWYSYDGAKLAQGRENVIQMLEDNIELAKEIEAKIIENLEV